VGRWGGSRVGGPVAIAPGAVRDATPRRDGAPGRARIGAQEQPEPGPIRGPVRTRPSKPVLAEASAPHGAARRRAPGPRVRGRCRWSDRDAKTDGRRLVMGTRPLRGTPGDRQSFKQASGGLAASRVPLGVCEVRCASPAGRSASRPPGPLSGPRGDPCCDGGVRPAGATGRGDGPRRRAGLPPRQGEASAEARR
jgi:hypothetical protein